MCALCDQQKSRTFANFFFAQCLYKEILCVVFFFFFGLPFHQFMFLYKTKVCLDLLKSQGRPSIFFGFFWCKIDFFVQLQNLPKLLQATFNLGSTSGALVWVIWICWFESLGLSVGGLGCVGLCVGLGGWVWVCVRVSLWVWVDESESVCVWVWVWIYVGLCGSGCGSGWV